MKLFNFLKKKTKTKETTEEPGDRDFGEQLTEAEKEEAAEKLKRDLQEEVTKEEEEETVATEIGTFNLQELGDIFPDKIVEGAHDDIKLYVQKLCYKGGKTVYTPFPLPSGEEQLLPLNYEDLEVMCGPGRYYVKLFHKKTRKYIFLKSFTFVASVASDEKYYEKTEEPEKVEANEKFKQEMIEQVATIKEMIKTKGGLTFEQQLIMKLLTDSGKKGGSEINESLMNAFANVKSQEIKSGAEVRKTEIGSTTELAKMKMEIEKAKIGIAATLDELPDEFKTKEEAEEGLGKVVNGVNKFVEGMSNFMNNLSNVIEKAQKPGQQEDAEEDIEARAEKIAGETMSEDK